MTSGVLSQPRTARPQVLAKGAHTDSRAAVTACGFLQPEAFLWIHILTCLLSRPHNLNLNPGKVTGKGLTVYEKAHRFKHQSLRSPRGLVSSGPAHHSASCLSDTHIHRDIPDPELRAYTRLTPVASMRGGPASAHILVQGRLKKSQHLPQDDMVHRDQLRGPKQT